MCSKFVQCTVTPVQSVTAGPLVEILSRTYQVPDHGLWSSIWFHIYQYTDTSDQVDTVTVTKSKWTLINGDKSQWHLIPNINIRMLLIEGLTAFVIRHPDGNIFCIFSAVKKILSKDLTHLLVDKHLSTIFEVIFHTKLKVKVFIWLSIFQPVSLRHFGCCFYIVFHIWYDLLLLWVNFSKDIHNQSTIYLFIIDNFNEQDLPQMTCCILDANKFVGFFPC